MDSVRFDVLTRALAAEASRRRVLKGLVAGIMGGAVALTTAKQTLAGVPVCAGPGEACSGSVEAAGEPVPVCCDGLLCCEGDPGVCAECCEDTDCGDGEICCAAACQAIECCIDDILTGGDPNDRCPEGTSCFEGYCDPFCQSDDHCAEGTCCCNDGSCFAECCEKPDVPPIDTLPNTGAGAADATSGRFGLVAVAGAAAWIAGRYARRGIHAPGGAEHAE